MQLSELLNKLPSEKALIDQITLANELAQLAISAVRERMESGFAQLGIYNLSVKAHDVRRNVSNGPKAEFVVPHVNHTAYVQPKRQRSRSRGGHQVVKVQRAQAAATPQQQQVQPRAQPQPQNQRSGPSRQMKYSACPFCTYVTCRSPSDCGLSKPWTYREKVHRELGLCPDRTCFKPHSGQCHKKYEVACNHCGGEHHVVFCERFAAHQLALAVEKANQAPAKDQDMADVPGCSKA